MARIFISHSSLDNAAAIALRDWLVEHGYDDVFLDVDPERGLVAGQRWQEALKAAADRCEAVLFLISPSWLQSRWCLAEFLLAKSLHKRIFGVVVATVPLDHIPTEMTAEWQVCHLAGEDGLRTFNVDVLGRRVRVEFRDTGLELLRRGLELAGLDARSFVWPPREEPNRAPYRGLKALEEIDAPIFFGRDAWIVRGLDTIRGLAERGIERLLLILGASGSGKSSFLRAGLWPRLLRDDVNFLPLPIVRPQGNVISGSSGIAAALAGAFTRLGKIRSPGRIRDELAEGSVAFTRLLGELVALAKKRQVIESVRDPVILLAIDQAEELFNADGALEANRFLDILAGVLARTESVVVPRVLVIATMRSDRLEMVQNEGRLEAARPVLFDLPRLHPTEFKSVIEGPARRVTETGGRLSVEPALTDRLIAEAQGADALPLLGFTLERLYADYGSDGRLTLADYERLGGTQGSIEAAVAAALAGPARAPTIPGDRDEQYALLRSAFIPWLARVDAETGTPMRRVAARSEIPETSHAIIERLVEARLLVADRRDGRDVIEIAHESLLRQWPALVAWLAADAADLVLVEGVEQAAAAWARHGRLKSWLDHRGERLAAAEHLLTRPDFGRRLGSTGAAYLSAARTRENLGRRARKLAWGTVLAACILLGIGISLGYGELQQALAYNRARAEEAGRTDIRGSLIAYSTQQGSVAADGEGWNGIYTGSLLKFLNEKSLTAEQVLLRTNQELVTSYRDLQVPEYSSSLNGALFLHDPPKGRRAFLMVIGNANYKFLPKLKNPQNDAEDVAAALGAMGYDVRLLLDATQGQMINAFAELNRKLESAREEGSTQTEESPAVNPAPAANTLVLLYFAGTGVEVGGQTYFAGIDADVKNRNDLESQTINVTRLLADLRSRAAAQIIIMDFCRNDPFK